MFTLSSIITVMFVEVILFLGELVLAVRNKTNRKLRKANSIEEAPFIDLEQGYRTSISIFRVSLFISYLLLVLLNTNSTSTQNPENIILAIAGLILVYLVSLFNIKTFVFYKDYFIVSSPFNFFKNNLFIDYEQIEDFRLYRALYNAYFLKLKMKDNESRNIQFASSSLPRNDLVVRVILNSRTGLNKNFEELTAKDPIL